jgi:endoglucanase
MIRRLLMAAGLAILAGCSGSSATDPSPGTGSGGGGSTGGDTGGGGGNNSGGGSAPLAAAVTVGNIFFKSGHNGSANAAVDTIAAGGTVTWTWTSTGTVPHSIESEGSPAFTSSAIQSGEGQKYQLQFSTPGTYRYDCAVHGAAMSGTIIVK